MALSESLQKLKTSRNDTQFDVAQTILSTLSDFQLVEKWLEPADVSSSSRHSELREERIPETGKWFLESDVFAEWKLVNGQPLWINGPSGTGKSFLCFAIIRGLKSYSLENEVPVLYFYFDYRHPESQTCENMIRSLLLQLHRFRERTHPYLLSLFKRCRNGIYAPTLQDLTDALLEMIAWFPQVFLAGEGLNECRETDWKDLLAFIETIRLQPSIHLLISAPPIKPFQDELEALGVKCVDLSEEIDLQQDIFAFINHKMECEEGMEKFGEKGRMLVRERAKDGGTFQWITMQFGHLSKCSTMKDFKQVIGSIPPTLDETYTRILNEIPSESKPMVRRMLKCLCFSLRPLTLVELVEAIALEDNIQPPFDLDGKILDPFEVSHCCPSLFNISYITVTEENVYLWDGSRVGDEMPIISLIHASLKQYLLKQTPDEFWRFSQEIGHIYMTKICIAYLLQFRQISTNITCHELLKQYPFASYAQDYVEKHAKKVAFHSELVEPFRLFLSSNSLPWMMSMLRDGQADRESLSECLEIPLSMAARLGRVENVVSLLGHPETKNRINHSAANYPLALHSAISHGHASIVKLLLKAGADPDHPDKYGCTALSIAAETGNHEIVQVLLEAGADINSPVPIYSPLSAASKHGNRRIVELLIAEGAEINATSPGMDPPISHAAANNHRDIVAVLQQLGADIGLRGDGKYGCALTAAAANGNFRMVDMLLLTGAKANIVGGLFGTPLQAAAFDGNLDTITLLLQAGANVNSRGGVFGTALHAAAFKGRTKVVQLLIGMNARVNVFSGKYKSAIHAAILGKSKQDEKIVKILLESGAEPDGGVVGDDRGTRSPLRDAAMLGRREIVELLLKAGAYVGSCGYDEPDSTDLQNVLADPSTGTGARDLVEMILMQELGTFCE